MARKRDIDTQSEVDARVEDYWCAMQQLADKYRADPFIRRKQRLETLKYWLITTVFSTVIGPMFLLLLLWSQAGIETGYVDFLSTPMAKALWVVAAMLGFACTVCFLPQKDKLWWRMAMDEIG